MEESKVYRKVGARYQEIGREWVGFPSNGLWLVAEGSRSLIMKVGDVLDPAPLAALARHQMAAAQALCELFSKTPYSRPSASEIVQVVYQATCKAEEARVAKERAANPNTRQAHGIDGMPVPTTPVNNVSAWMDKRKQEHFANEVRTFERRAEFNYYLNRDDHDSSVSWEMLTEEQRNEHRRLAAQ